MVTKKELKELEKAFKGAKKAFEASKEKVASKEQSKMELSDGRTIIRPNHKLLDAKKAYNKELKDINNLYQDICNQIYIIKDNEVTTNNEEKDILIKFIFNVEKVDFTLNQIFFYFMALAKMAKNEEKKNKAFEKLEEAKKHYREEKESKIKAKAER